MYRRRFIAARAKYRCEWKCAGCGRRSREGGEVAAADRLAVNRFTDNMADEVNLSGEIAQEKARKKLFRLQEAVNGRRWLQGLRISGVCRRCGRRQFWASAVRHAWTVVMAAACLAALIVLNGLPAGGAAWLGYLAAAAAAALLTEGASLLLTRWRLGWLADQECAPWVEEFFPDM